MSDPVTRLNAALEGRYRIERELGAGGMATVYLARDVKHNRLVALKVLKPELAAVVGADRFLAEIETTANLQHPHILPLFDSGEADSFLFYVMPYVEGETLQDRLGREHQLPVADAVRIAGDVAEALEYAHGQGVIHRDIKPANILIQAGRPVISDFGIALAVGAAGGGRLTETGLSVGTPHYMSPEQATGDLNVGPASDIYALGCVLYEMLVGEPPYTGSNAQAILGKIIAGRVSAPTEHRASVPANVDAAIRRALERVPADRFTRAADFSQALANPAFRHGPEADRTLVEAAVASRGLWKPLAVALTVLSLVLLAVSSWSWLRPAPQPRVIALEIDLPTSGNGAFTLAPDGSFVLHSAGGSEGRLRRLESLESEPLALRCCSNGARVSPDGQFYIDFDGQEGVDFIGSVLAGTRIALGRVGFAAWGRDGSVYVLRDDTLYRRALPQSEPVPLAAVALDGALRHPEVLPGGKGILVVRVDGESNTIHSIDTRDGSVAQIIEGLSPRYVDTGHLLFGRLDGALMAVPFDPDAMEITGAPLPTRHTVAERGGGGGGALAMSISDDGTLLYQVRGSRESRLVQVGRDGRETPLGGDLGEDIGPIALSPAGTNVATTVGAGAASRRLVVKALPDGPMTELAPGIVPGGSTYPSWDPTGEWVYFNVDGALWKVRGDGSRPPESVLELERSIAEGRVLKDGTLVLRTFPSQLRPRDILILAPGDSEPREFISSDEDQVGPEVSPDGRWLAYQSGSLTRPEVFIRPFPEGDAQYAVSSGGGERPEWSPGGSELLYLNAEGDLMSVEVSGEESLRISTPRVVSTRTRDFERGFEVFPDDQSFLFVESGGEGRRHVMVLNFFEELKRLFPN